MIPLSYSARSLLARRSTSLATIAGLALVVFVLSSVLMVGRSIHRTLGRTASADMVILMRRGSDSEVSSSVLKFKVDDILAKRGIAKLSDGKPAGAGEVYVVMNVRKRASGEDTRVAVRGIDDRSIPLRRSLTVVAGRAPRPGTDEAMIGIALRGGYERLGLGQTFELSPNRPISVVGVFSDQGSSYEAEVWGDLDVVSEAFHRDAVVSSVRARLESPSALDTFRADVEADPELPALSIEREATYYEQQSESASSVIVGIGLLTAALVSIGAMVGATITMHASIANRQREIGTLRALGFSRAGVLMAFLAESVLLALVGGIAGGIASLALTRVTFAMSTMADINVHVFGFETSPAILGGSILAAVVMGLLGGAIPAVRAAFMNPSLAMRGA